MSGSTTEQPQPQVGDLVNGHRLTWNQDSQAYEWVREHQPGDVVNGHQFTGAEWVPYAPPTQAPTLREEIRKVRRQMQEAKATNKAEAGEPILREVFAHKVITITENGYAKVTSTGAGNFHKILGVDYTDNITNKNGLGRGMVAVATVGTNLAFSGHKRGSGYLTLVTEERTWTIQGRWNDAKAGNKIAAVANAVKS